MNFNKCIIKSFSVIGKEGSTNDGDDFINKLWDKVNSSIHEIDHLVKKENGQYKGIWGLMSDVSRRFYPWDNNYSRGLYLAGVEVEDKANAINKWVKWTVPSFEYIYFPVEGEYKNAFINGFKILEDNKLPFVGAVQEFYCPIEKNYIYSIQ